MTAPPCIASIERAIDQLTNAVLLKREFPGAFLAGTYTGFAVHHLRAAARAAPAPHRMRLARLAGMLRMAVRRRGCSPNANFLTATAISAREISAAMQEKGK